MVPQCVSGRAGFCCGLAAGVAACLLAGLTGVFSHPAEAQDLPREARDVPPPSATPVAPPEIPQATPPPAPRLAPAPSAAVPQESPTPPQALPPSPRPPAPAGPVAGDLLPAPSTPPVLPPKPSLEQLFRHLEQARADKAAAEKAERDLAAAIREALREQRGALEEYERRLEKLGLAEPVSTGVETRPRSSGF